MTGQSLATSIIVARSQGATSFSPALVGAVTRFPMPSLIFTVLLARREAAAQLPSTTAVGTGKVPFPMPPVTNQFVSDATDTLLNLGLVVTLSGRDTVVEAGIVIEQSIPPNQPVVAGTAVNLVVSLGLVSPPAG
jgi:Uncharacterized protein conserved in bacteria